MPTIPRPTCWSRFPTRRCRSRRPEGIARLLAGPAGAGILAIAGAGWTQPLVVPSQPLACPSVVVVRCDPPPGAAPSARGDRAQRIDERRRAPLESIELERIVIEADPIRPSLAETLGRPFALRPTSGTRTFTTGEGAQCTCMNRCPPFPFPCCDCSAPMDAYSRTPGGFSPLR